MAEVRSLDDARIGRDRIDDGSSITDLPHAFRYFAGRASPRLLMAATATAIALRIAVGNWSALDLIPVSVSDPESSRYTDASDRVPNACILLLL